MMGKMEVKTSPGGRPRDGRHCDLCGCSQPAVRCDKCGCQIFCLSCDDMYHRHPKRRFHLRKAVDPIPAIPQARPVLPMKVAHLNATNPGDPSKMPLPPPRKKKSIFGGFRRTSPSPDQSSPNLPKKEYSWTDRLGSIKKFMSNRPLPPLPTGEDNDGDSSPTTNGQSPIRGDLSFIHKRSDERPPQLPQRSPKSPDMPAMNQERENRFPNATMQMPGQIRNGTMEPNVNNAHQNHDFSTNNDSQWNNRIPNQNGPQVFGTLQRQNHKGFMSPGVPGYPGGMHQSSSATDLHSLQNIEGMPGAVPQPPHYPHYPVNPHMPPHYPYPMYPQFPNYPQYFGHSFANLSNPPTTDGDVSDQSENTSSRHSSKKHPFRKRAKRSQSVMMDRMAYPGQFPYPGPYGPYPGYGPWGTPMPMETPPSPASSLRSLSRNGRTRRRKKMTSEDDDEEFSVSSSPLSRPKSSSSGQKDSPQRAPLATQTTSSEEESEDEIRNRRNKVNTIQRRQSESLRTSLSPAEEPSRKTSKLKKSSSTKQSDSESQEIPPQVRYERRPSNDSMQDQLASQQSSSSPAPAPSPTWECKHCTYINPISNRICQVCCKSAAPMPESPVPVNSSRPSSSAADSPKPNLDLRKDLSSPDKTQENDDDSGKKEKHDMEILNSALDEAEKEISRGLEELMKLKDDIDTSIGKDVKNEREENSKPVYKSSGRMRTSILDKLNLNKSQATKSTASTSTDTQTGQGSWTNDKILEGRRPSNASSASDTYNSPVAQSPELERRFPANMQKRDSSCQTQQDSSCQTQQDSLAEYLERKKIAEESFLGRPINNFGFGYGDRMDMMQSPVPTMYDRFFGGGMGGMMQRSHSRASLFSGRINDPMDFAGPGYGYGPTPMYRSISRGSLTGDYPEGRLSEFHNLRKPDFYLSMEELVERRRQETMRAQGLELVRMIREAEQQGFTADDIQVALTHCGKQSPMEWLQDNWRNMLDSVVTLSTNYGNDKKENDIGVLSENEAREALRLHKGNIWAAVTECVEGRQRKYLELSARGKFSRKDIVDALTSSDGDVEMAYAKLTKSTGKPFLMRIWGDGEGAQNQDGAQPMPENMSDIQNRYQKDDLATSDFLSDELWSEDEEDVEWEEEEYDDERADFEDLQTCHEDLNLGPQEMRTPESDRSEYIDAFALEDRNLSSPSDDIFFVIPDQKPEKKKGFLGKLAALRRDSKEQGDTVSISLKEDNSSDQSLQSKRDTVPQTSASVTEQSKGNGALSALKSTLTAIKETVTGNSKSDKKLPCSQPEKRTIVVSGQIEHESFSTDSNNAVKLASIKSLEDDLPQQKPEEKFSETLKEINKKTEVLKDINKSESKVSSDNLSLETLKELKKSTDFKKEDSKDEKLDVKTLRDNEINTNNQSDINQKLSEIPSQNQTEMKSKTEKKKSQSLAERLKFAKQTQAAKTSTSSVIQNDDSIPSTSKVISSNKNNHSQNQGNVNNSYEREKSEITSQKQISKVATDVRGTNGKETTIQTSTKTTEKRQTHDEHDITIENSSPSNNSTVNSTLENTDFPTSIESTTAVIKESPSPQKEISTKNSDLTKAISENLAKRPLSPTTSKAKEVINQEKVKSPKKENLLVQPGALQKKRLKESETNFNVIKQQENRETSQNKEITKETAVVENKLSKTVLSDTKNAFEETVATIAPNIPKSVEKLVVKDEDLKVNVSSGLKESISNAGDVKLSEASYNKNTRSDKLNLETNIKKEPLQEIASGTEQKPSTAETETSNKKRDKSGGNVADNQSPQTVKKNVFDSVLNVKTVEPKLKVEHEQASLTNVENTALKTPHDMVENAGNVSNDESYEKIFFYDALENVETTNNVSSEETIKQEKQKSIKNSITASSEKLVSDKGESSNTDKSKETLSNIIIENKVENATTIAEIEKTQQESDSLIQSEIQKHVSTGNAENIMIETSNEYVMNYHTTSNKNVSENETKGKQLLSIGNETDITANSSDTKKTSPEKSAEIMQLSAQNDLTIESVTKESNVTNEDNKPVNIQEEEKQQLNNSDQLKNSNKDNFLLLDHKTEIRESQILSGMLPESKEGTEVPNTTTISHDMTLSSTSKTNIKVAESSEAATAEQIPPVINSDTVEGKKETRIELASNVEENSQIDKAKSEIDSSEIESSQNNVAENVDSSKETNSMIIDNLKDSNQSISMKDETSEQKVDVNIKSDQNLDNRSELPQSTAGTSESNKNISVPSTSTAKNFSRTPKEVKSGKLISEKIERLRRSFSKEENDIKLYFRDKNTSKSEGSANSSSTSSDIASKNDVKTNLGASSSTAEVPSPQNNHQGSTEDKKILHEKELNEDQTKPEVKIEKTHSVTTLETNLESNVSEQSGGENITSSERKNEETVYQIASSTSSDSKQTKELLNSASTSGDNVTSPTSEDILTIPETSVISATMQSLPTPEEVTLNSMTDTNLQEHSRNENKLEIMQTNHITNNETNVIDATSSNTNAADISLSAISEINSNSASETQVSTYINAEVKEITEATTSSEQSEHSNTQDNITDFPLSSASNIEQTLENISEKHSETKVSASNNYDSDDTDIEYSDDESRPSSVTPPNPIDTLRSRFENLAGGTSGRGLIRPQSPFRRMSLNSRKQVIALEKIRDTKLDKPWYQQKCEPIQVKTYPKRTIKQQLEMERKVRKLVSDRVVATYRKAETVVQLMDLNFEQEEAIQAANECSTLEQAISYLQQECQLCTGYFPVSQIVSMTHCQHRACRECIRAYFTVQIRDRTILDLLCPFCNQPDIGDEDVAQDYFNHLDIMLKKLVDVEIHELFQRKLRDRVLMKDPNFRWCSQCSSGFIAMPNLTRLVCPDCNAITCASCRRLWERDHQGISCEAFASLKDASDPEAQAAGLAKMLTEDGIECPSCHFKYALAKGGCMHFRCIQCQHDFCSGCSRPFKMGQKCGVSEFCAKLGLHAHHPRNCLFYLRDKEPEDLQKLLDMSNCKYNKDPPEGMEVKDICQVMEQKETADGMVDDYCGKEIQDGYAGLCRVHYVEYLGQLVNKHKVDPIQIFENDDLELVLRRANIRLPPRRYRENDAQYREKLVKLIQEELPLDKMEGS